MITLAYKDLLWVATWISISTAKTLPVSKSGAKKYHTAESPRVLECWRWKRGFTAARQICNGPSGWTPPKKIRGAITGNYCQRFHSGANHFQFLKALFDTIWHTTCFQCNYVVKSEKYQDGLTFSLIPFNYQQTSLRLRWNRCLHQIANGYSKLKFNSIKLALSVVAFRWLMGGWAARPMCRKEWWTVARHHRHLSFIVY